MRTTGMRQTQIYFVQNSVLVDPILHKKEPQLRRG